MSQLLDKNGLNEQQFLEQYNPGNYDCPSVTADIVIFAVGNVQMNNYRKLPEKELRILLIQRGGHPYLGHWALPGGFVHSNETVGQAAHRELAEETGVQGGYLEQLYTFSQPGRDPRAWVISCAHMALIDCEKLMLNPGSDADDARWFVVKTENAEDHIKLLVSNEDTTLSASLTLNPYDTSINILENNGFAFDHAKIIMCAINRLRAKLDYTDVAFDLMPEKFTLTELQQVYEAILGKPLYKAAFRRKIKNLVAETDEFTKSAGHRPSQIFIKRKDLGKCKN